MAKKGQRQNMEKSFVKKTNQSVKKIEQIFIKLIQKDPLNRITVSEICAKAGINRSGFYANFTDIYDLADYMVESLNRELRTVYAPEPYVHQDDTYLHLLEHIYDHQELYKACFHLGYEKKYPFSLCDESLAASRYGNRHIEYHSAFFNAGLNRIIELWLENGCRESPREMADIIKEEYQAK